LTNTAGGLGAESALDFNTLLPSTSGTYNPGSRIVAQDADMYSDNLLFQSNVPGKQNNTLQTNMIIASNGQVGIHTTPTYGQLSVQTSPGDTQLHQAIYGQIYTQSQDGPDFAQSPAAIYADGGSAIGLLAVTEASIAGFFVNNSNLSEPGFASTVNIADLGSMGYLLIATDGPSGGISCTIDDSANLSCTGTIAGSNVTADKRTVKTYAMQAAENWYEDACSGELQGGSARIDLDPEFGETVNTGVEYHVFLTPNGDCKGLYVANKTADGFEVRELGGGKSNIAFDYRIMAKRKGYEQVRLEDITEKVRKLAEQREKMVKPRTSPNAVPRSSTSAALQLGPPAASAANRQLAQPSAPVVTTPSHGAPLKPINPTETK